MQFSSSIPEAQTQPAPSTTSAAPAPSPVVSATTRPRVSLATKCPQVLKHQQAALALVTEFTTEAQSQANSRSAARFDQVIAEFDYALEVAPEQPVSFIQQQRVTMSNLREYMQVVGSRTTDLRDFRPSGPRSRINASPSHDDLRRARTSWPDASAGTAHRGLRS